MELLVELICRVHNDKATARLEQLQNQKREYEAKTDHGGLSQEREELR